MSKTAERRAARANRIAEPGKGVPCISCGSITELRRHKEITPKLLSQPFYYERWYNCTNADCRTTIFMEEKDKVENQPTREMRKRQERLDKISFFRSL